MKKKRLDWQRERNDENEYGTVQCEGTWQKRMAHYSLQPLRRHGTLID